MVTRVKVVNGSLNETTINKACSEVMGSIKDIKFLDSRTCVIVYDTFTPPRNG